MNAPPSPAAPVTRRRFLRETALAASAWGLAGNAVSAAVEATESAQPTTHPTCVFTKPFQSLNAERTADLVASIGWDGIECPVRAKGQIEPDRAPDLLPAYVEALKKRDLTFFIATTDIQRIDQKHAESTLRTLAKAGVRRFRLGPHKYDLSRSPAQQLVEIGARLRDIAAACADLGLQAGFQNHSGRNNVGAPVWDVYSIIKDIDPRHIGFCFDIGHATIEGGLDWPIQARLAEPHYTAVYVKDFVWKRTDQGWRESWCLLGEGMVNRTFFDGLKKSAYRGPVSQHHEYHWTDETEMLTMMRHDLRVLKNWLAA